MQASPSQIQFVAGFFDGDGSVTCCLAGGTKDTKTVPRIMFFQSCTTVPPELVYIQSLYGGSIYASSRKLKSTHRPRWSLYIGATVDVMRLLRDLATTCVVKLPQVEEALRYMDSDRQSPKDCRLRLSQLKSATNDVTIDASRLTDPYLAGLFASEGTVGIYKLSNGGKTFVMTVNIAQGGCIPLLVAIKSVLGCGSHPTNGHLYLSARIAEQFLLRIQPFVIGQKVPQIKLALEFQSKKCFTGKRSVTEVAESEIASAELKKLKRQ